MTGFFNPFAGGAGGKAPAASEIPYDGSSSGISATDVQGAIDEVQENIENIPRPMSYQGTLGVGGEITELPAPSEANRGYTYKVATAGIYQGITAEVGDTFISYATRWDLVPSGDEPGGTVLSVGVTSNDDSVTVTGSPITTAGSIDVSVNVDNELSDTSTKPVQNKIVTSAINEKLDIEDAVGKNVTGTEYTIDGQTVTAGDGAEIFNDYVNNKAAGQYSHAEGMGNTASGAGTHAEGSGSVASGTSSHAEGTGTQATGDYSHAEGERTRAASSNQHVQGKYNVADANNIYAFIIGNGTADNARHNAFAIDWNGNIYVNNSATGVNVETLSSILNPISESEYDAITTKDKPLYFIYET